MIISHPQPESLPRPKNPFEQPLSQFPPQKKRRMIIQIMLEQELLQLSDLWQEQFVAVKSLIVSLHNCVCYILCKWKKMLHHKT